MIQLLTGAALTLHGLIHLVGFVAAWRIAEVAGFPYRTTALNGALQLGDSGARALGVAWLVIALGFVVAGIGVWRGSTWALALTGVLAVASLVVCTLGLPEAVAGIVVNVVILAVVLWVGVRQGTTLTTS